MTKKWNLDDTIQQALHNLQVHTYTLVQEKSIPYLLQYTSMFIQSVTGSGKTYAFLIPVLSNLTWDTKNPQALILEPTRELALQVKKEAETLGIYKKIRCVSLIGKVPYAFQVQDLAQRTNLVTGTIGRILHHIEEKQLRLQDLKYFIVDEIDEILKDKNNKEKLQQLLALLPSACCLCYVSATVNEEVEEFLTKQDQTFLRVSCNNEVQNLKYYAYHPKENSAQENLFHVLKNLKEKKGMVFFNTCMQVMNMIKEQVDRSLSIAYLHGKLTQEERLKQWEAFSTNQVSCIFTTDVASRGLDLQDIDYVIHYDLPREQEKFYHRNGRCCRLQMQGIILVFMTKENQEILSTWKDQTLVLEQIDDVKDSLQTLFPEKKVSNRKEHNDVDTLYIYAGKQKKIRVKDIVGAILNIEGITFSDIGVIQLESYGSYVEILNHKVAYVYQQLQHTPIKGKIYKVEYAKRKRMQS